ncbi:MAG: hypothetical protein L6R40_006714 [Gallowayella cf. fulva]|nr:MAG: hypothetical protein L6R40_006714 [Xanthomendoza cf. fulva]
MIEPAATLQSVSPQTDGLAASRATHATDSITLSRTTATTHDISVQTDPRPESFKPLSLYGYNSEISVLPDFCNVTLHLDPDREIRISRVSANAVRRISDILQGEPMSSYERNWLTPGEIAEAQAEAERQQRLAAANKRKRDEDTELPQAQRPRVTPRSTTSAKPMRRMQFMRTSGHPFGRSLAAIRAHPLGDDEAGPYNQNGDLQLSGVTSSDIQDEDPLINATVADPIPSANATADETPHVESSSTNAGTGSTDAQDAEVGTTHTNEQQLQTPRTGSWGFGSLVNSAIRYVPSFGRQRTSQQPVAQTEVRRPATMAGHADFGQRLHSSQAAAQKTFRTKENIAAMKASKAERVRIKEEWARLDEAQKAAEQERLELAEAKRITELEKQDVAEAHRAAIANQPPGSKKRRHSPSVIPNPKGASYGLDLDFFTYSDSSSDEDQEASPSRKSRRISGPDHSRSKTPTINDRTTSLVHGPHASSSERATEYKGSRFSDSPPNVFGQAKIRSSTVISKNDPGFNHRGHFEVPYSSSSSEGDSSSDEEDVATSVVNNPPPLLPLGTHDSSGKESGKVAPAASPQKSATGPEFPPVTPAPKQVAAVPETQRNLEAAKTLQRNREILRAKIAGQNKSVLSPKDIPSPSKVHNTSQAVTQPTPQLTTPAIFFQPPQTSTGAPLTAPSKDDGFSILGAANQKGPKSPARMLAETLPSIQDRVNKLQSYNDFQRAMDPRVKATVESSWDDGDEAATGNDFRNAFLDFSNAHEQDSTRPVLSASHDYQQASDDEATDEEDHASLYADEDNNLDQEQDSDADNGLLNDTDEEQAQGTESEEDNGATVPITGTPSFFGTPPSFEIPPSFDHHWDPVVAAFMKANWTAEDEAAASAEFKTKIASEEA